MSSSTFRRTAVVALTLTLGTLALPSAEAAPARSASKPGVSVQGDLIARSLFDAVKSVLHLGKEYYGGQNPGNNPPGKEGAGICPLGNPGNNGNPHPGRG